MIIATSSNVPGTRSANSHGGEGEYFVRTLLEGITESMIEYVRDLTLSPGASIGVHLHESDEELYFIISGTGMMAVDGEERQVSPGSAVLTQAGSRHGLKNTGDDELRIVVVCASWSRQKEGA